ncbi:MAG: alpha-amylase family protein [Streptosporangiaceae bacterium]
MTAAGPPAGSQAGHPPERREPGWVQNMIWWHIYPLGFLGCHPARPGTPSRTLDAITDWLDYAVDLGVSGLALGPVFASGAHGYDTLDYFRIDERLGDDRSFDRLVSASRQRGLRILLDGVFNHVGAGYRQFRQTARGEATAAQARWFVPVKRAGDAAGPAYRTFEGHESLIVLNHDEPAVGDFVVRVMQHWLGRGISGWRLDAAYAVPPAFWASVLPRVRATHPDAYFAGEVIHGDYSAFVRDSTADAVTQYELWKAIWSSLNDANFWELAHALKRHDGLLGTFVPVTFVGNHDVTRIASKLADERHLGHALAILLTVAGTPSVYYGDEQGFHGIKTDSPGGDDEIRPAFPGSGSAGLASFGWPVYRLHQQLIGFRRRHPWLHAASVTIVRLTNEFIAYECRSGPDRVLVGLNVSDTTESVEAPGPGGELVCPPGASVTGGMLTVPGHEWAVWSSAAG